MPHLHCLISTRAICCLMRFERETELAVCNNCARSRIRRYGTRASQLKSHGDTGLQCLIRLERDMIGSLIYIDPIFRSESLRGVLYCWP